MSRRSIAAWCIVSALLFAACGSSSAPPPAVSATPAVARSTSGAEPAVDQCSLLTEAEVEAATGRKVVSAGKDPAGLSRCLWVLEPATENRTVGVTAYIADPRAATDFAFDTREATAVAGLGDAAGYEIRTGGDYVLNVLRGADRFRFRASFGARPDETNFASFEMLARKILGRL